MSGLPPSYPNLSGLPYDPTLFTPLRRNALSVQHIHPSLMSRHAQLHQASTSLNQINPVQIFSTNDNNNSNRSRAASHSSIIEGQQHSGQPHLPLHPIHPYLSSSYLTHKPHAPPTYLQEPGGSPSGYRRNSTTAVFPHHDLEPPRISGLGRIDFASLAPSNLHYRSHYLYGRGLLPTHLPMYKDLYPSDVPRGGFRRNRYSIGASLPLTEHLPNPTETRRRNSIPTGLEIHRPPCESSTSSDDDDVFDESPINTQPQDAASSQTSLEELRESRKRALSAGEPSTSRTKYSRREEDAPRSARCFRRRITHDENDDSRVTSVSRAFEGHSTVPMQTQTPSIPGPSNVCPENSEEPSVSIVTSTRQSAEKTISNRSVSTSIPSITISEASGTPAISTTRGNVVSVSRQSTPSPSILKKSRKINRNALKNAASQNTSATSDEISHPTRASTPKKQVAWKDKPKLNVSSGNDVIMSPVNCDLLPEQNILRIRKKPNSFTLENRIGPYLIGPQIGTSPVKSITQYLVRKENTYKYYMAKVLSMNCSTNDNKSGRMLLHSENSILTLLKNHPGVVQHRGFHKDVTYNPKNGKVQERLCLIVDCLTQHDYDEESYDFLNLQQHVIQAKRLSERETIRIFTSIVQVVQSLHELHVVHRDLKLVNMVLYKKTQKIILTNFCLSRHLMSGNELLKDQRGSPAYISPDVLSCKPYAGKPSDMWSLGVVLYMMLYGKFPFYDQEPSELFRKIKKADFDIPSDIRTTSNIDDIIRGLLTLDPSQRLTADDTLLALHRCANSLIAVRYLSLDAQVVPDLDRETSSDEEEKNEELEHQKYLEEKLTRDFQKKMLSEDDKHDSTEAYVKGFSRTTFQATAPTIHHVTGDACRLTQNEMIQHRHIIANATLGGVRVGNPTVI